MRGTESRGEGKKEEGGGGAPERGGNGARDLNDPRARVTRGGSSRIILSADTARYRVTVRVSRDNGVKSSARERDCGLKLLDAKLRDISASRTMTIVTDAESRSASRVTIITILTRKIITQDHKK